MTTTSKNMIDAARAGSHMGGPELVAWAGRVDDLLVARIMRLVEAGIEIRRAVNGRWYAPDDDPLRFFPVSEAVNEMIRVGLFINQPWAALVPAKVHLSNGHRLSWCGTPGEGGERCVRLVGDPVAVDCLECLELAWGSLLAPRL